MANSPPLVQTREGLLRNAREYQRAVGQASASIKPSQVLRWYYFPKERVVGASRFIGYEGMTAELYDEILEGNGMTINGGTTSKHLQNTGWFEPIESGPDFDKAWSLARGLVRSVSPGSSVNKSALFFKYK